MGVLSREAIRRIDAKLAEVYLFPKTEYAEGYVAACEAAKKMILELEHLEPEIINCAKCKHIQKWRSEESAKKFGQIYECGRGVLMCPGPEDFCSKAKRRTDGKGRD